MTRWCRRPLPALWLVMTLPGCGPSTTSQIEPPGAAANPGTAVLPPVIVAANQTSVSAKVGDTIVFSVANPTATTVSATPAGVLELSQGYARASAVFNPGAKAIAPGQTTVSIAEGERIRKVSVTVERR